MVHKRAIILIVVAIVVCCSALVIGLLSDDEDGVTVASREAILQDLPKGIDWQIASEILIDDYLLSSIILLPRMGWRFLLRKKTVAMNIKVSIMLIKAI